MVLEIPLHGIPEASKRSGISRALLHYYIKVSKINAYLVGDKYFLDDEEVKKLKGINSEKTKNVA